MGRGAPGFPIFPSFKRDRDFCQNGSHRSPGNANLAPTWTKTTSSQTTLKTRPLATPPAPKLSNTRPPSGRASLPFPSAPPTSSSRPHEKCPGVCIQVFTSADVGGADGTRRATTTGRRARVAVRVVALRLYGLVAWLGVRAHRALPNGLRLTTPTLSPFCPDASAVRPTATSSDVAAGD